MRDLEGMEKLAKQLTWHSRSVRSQVDRDFGDDPYFIRLFFNYGQGLVKQVQPSGMLRLKVWNEEKLCMVTVLNTFDPEKIKDTFKDINQLLAK